MIDNVKHLWQLRIIIRHHNEAFDIVAIVVPWIVDNFDMKIYKKMIDGLAGIYFSTGDTLNLSFCNEVDRNIFFIRWSDDYAINIV